ncbi:3-oxoadipate enol-lactonase [Profundibacterium mesophilum]|uniref:Beta-ketoadipate enol-lactone hydrolase n=1 Tax=Profundibacterium mesophilum KAUST100406-0324 TaxID=1037889 RepID=A0A921TDH7_9RHOB|nr:3-oxoadipate enol-lactonase [Profundibacterium mesophilum]KAF0676227.1 Beta-ketoadipate enol-lactone hydrolase [Profundibacterium mesophilum KAUST100406-0324]
MSIMRLDDVDLHYRDTGPREAPALVFANSLGTDLRLWDDLLEHLPAGLRIIRYDMRGHGLSGCPPAPYKMGTLVRDAERLLDHLRVRDCVFVGLSIGGMVAQGLAVKRLDLLRGVVLASTASKIGTAQMWHDRIEAVARGGMSALSPGVLERWFSPAFRGLPEFAQWRAMLERQPPEGYAGCAAAIAGCDLLAATATLRLPALVIAGDEDGATPPDLVRETAQLIPGAEFALIRGAGHLPNVERPDAFAARLNAFLARIAHPR